jgi:polar amino acid transport system substrate-binding protein
VLDKGSPLTACVSKAVDELGNGGELFKLQKVWLTGAGAAPTLS